MIDAAIVSDQKTTSILNACSLANPYRSHDRARRSDPRCFSLLSSPFPPPDRGTLEAQEGRLFAPLAWTRPSPWRQPPSIGDLVPVLMPVFIPRPHQTGSREPGESGHHQPLPAGHRHRHTGEAGHRGAFAVVALAVTDHPPAAWAAVHADLERRHPSSTCPPPCHPVPVTRRRNCCRPRTRSQEFPDRPRCRQGRVAQTATDPAPLKCSRR